MVLDRSVKPPTAECVLDSTVVVELPFPAPCVELEADVTCELLVLVSLVLVLDPVVLVLVLTVVLVVRVVLVDVWLELELLSGVVSDVEELSVVTELLVAVDEVRLLLAVGSDSVVEPVVELSVVVLPSEVVVVLSDVLSWVVDELDEPVEEVEEDSTSLFALTACVDRLVDVPVVVIKSPRSVTLKFIFLSPLHH